MTDDEIRPKTAAKRGKKPEARTRTGRFTGGLGLILASIGLIATGFLWYTLMLERTDVVGNLHKLQGDARALQEALAESGTQLDEVKTNQDTIRAALDKIQHDLSRHRVEWILAESEQLLVIANNRLQLARDVRSALAALRAADSQLNQIPNPAVLPARRELAREIAALEAIDKIDVGGISLKLASLAETANNLPIAPQVSRRASTTREAKIETGTVTDAPPAAGWRVSAHNLWQDLLSLVRIRTDVNVQRPLLPPEQEYFLRENLKFMLYGAQFGLLQGNVPVFHQNIKIAQQLLKDYYDTNAQAVTGMQAELEKLRSARLVSELPDISRSLTALRVVTGTRSTP